MHHQPSAASTHAAVSQDVRIDQFLAQSPSQSLGAEAIKLKHAGTIGSIPTLNFEEKQSSLSQHSISLGGKTSLVATADSYTPYSEQFNDSSPPNSLTGTAVSSRSGSPSFNNNGVDSAGLARGFKSDTYLSTKNKPSFDHGGHSVFLPQSLDPQFTPHPGAPKFQYSHDVSRADYPLNFGN